MLKLSKIKQNVIKLNEELRSTGDLKTDIAGLGEQNIVQYEDLKNNKKLGPLLSNRLVHGKLRQVYAKNPGHQCIIGSTRSGKTTCVIIPQICNLIHMADKPSVVASDPKGELYKITASEARACGYDVRVWNLRDFRYSDSYNILHSAFDLYVNKAAESKNPKSVIAEDGKLYVKYGDKLFKTLSKYREFVACEEQFHRHLAFEFIHDFVIQAVKNVSEKDPFWDNAAKDELEAYILALLEDVDGDNPKGVVTRDNFNMATVKAVFEDGLGKIKGSEFLKDRPNSSMAKRKAGGCINAPENTKNSIESVLASHISHFGNVVEKNVMLTSTFCAEDFIKKDKPMILYIIFPDEKSSGYEALSLFVADFYAKLVALKEKSKEQTRDVHFILDEFGNMPAIDDFDKKISVSAGRGIFMTLALQSYCQIEKRYPKECGTILDNIATTYFLSSNNYETQEKFSNMCGTKEVLSPLSVFSCDGESLNQSDSIQVPVLSIRQLSGLEEGEVYIKSSELKFVLKTHLERYYKCPEYACEASDIEDYQSVVDINDSKYSYTYNKKAKQIEDMFDF